MRSFILLLTLLFTSPAFAQQFDGSTFLDLSQLTFSGVDVSLAPFFQIQDAYSSENRDPLVTGQPEQSQHFDSRDPSTTPVATPVSTSAWAPLTLTSTTPRLSTTSTVTMTSLSASGTMTALNGVDTGAIFAQAWQRGALTALQSGTLTVTVPYTISLNTSYPPSLGYSGVSLVLDTQESIRAVAGQGVLLVSESLRAGQIVALDLVADVSNATSVPEPATYASLFIGLGGLLLALTRRA